MTTPTEQNINGESLANDTGSAIIVFGRDGSDKPHASKFAAEQRQEAAIAAAMMGFQALAVKGDALIEIAAGIAVGKVFASGKGFVPFVKRGVAETLEQTAKEHPEKLIALPTPEATEDPEGGDDMPGGGDGSSDDAHKPENWLGIQVGSRVLAVDDPEDGWWEAIVIHVHESGTRGYPMPMLTLRWEAFPDEKQFVRKAMEVGLIHPAF